MLNNSLISRIKIDVTNSRSQKLKKNQLYGDLNITNTLSVEYIPLELYNDLHNYTVIESYTIKCKYDNNVIVTMLSKRRLSKTFLKNLHSPRGQSPWGAKPLSRSSPQPVKSLVGPSPSYKVWPYYMTCRGVKYHS